MAKLSAKSLSAGILISFLLPVLAAGQIISPVRLFGRYQQSIWQDQQGLPQNGISRIVQTPDGYLWLAIAEGIAQLEKINEVKTAFAQQLIENQEAERQRLAVELHDSIGQSLIVIRNRALLSLSAPEKTERILEQMQEISASAAESIKEVREIAHNLHPYQLEHLGLTTALAKKAEINLYRIIQECLNNIVKHSGAHSVNISLKKNDGILSLSMEDDGKGFPVESVKGRGGLGLTGISERAKMLDAIYEINSLEGKGTRINLQMKLQTDE